MLIFSKFIYKFQTFTIKIPAGFRNLKSYSKIFIERKGPRRVKIIFEKETKFEGYLLPNSRTTVNSESSSHHEIGI